MNNPQKTPGAPSRGDPNAGSGAFKTPDPEKADSTSDDDSMEWEKLKQEYLKLKKEEKELLESAAELQAQKNDLEEKLGKANASGSRMIKDAVAVVCLNGTELEYVSVPDAELPAVIVADGGILLHSLRERASVWPEGPSTYGLLKSMVDNGDDIRDAFDWAKNVTWIDCLQDATHSKCTPRPSTASILTTVIDVSLAPASHALTLPSLSNFSPF